ncbi:hypothetical protein AURDEDRAFT_176449 [Auricularia subglabra TFB-10046 SS5]|uniref:Uncharacterized protein n=1 Tax=Auricularia subglabra (strain TFB-10046 / SS5) TaxID=717982 RepID=J0WRD8_AURST|nr:hypothetical protein AURDEDRAFT_176449 [Auricularia subglabra TFB-10046 SS5]
MSVPRAPRAFLSKLRHCMRRNKQPAAARGVEPRTHQAGLEVHAGVDDVDIKLEAGLATIAGALGHIPTVVVSGQGAVADIGAEHTVLRGGDDGPAAVREEEGEPEPARVDQLDQDVANGIGGNEHANGVGGDGHANAIPGEGEGTPTATQALEPEPEGAQDEAPDQDAPDGAALPMPPTTAEFIVRAVCNMTQYYALQWVLAVQRTYPAVQSAIFDVLTACILVSPLLPLAVVSFVGLTFLLTFILTICFLAVLFQTQHLHGPPSAA